MGGSRSTVGQAAAEVSTCPVGTGNSNRESTFDCDRDVKLLIGTGTDKESSSSSTLLGGERLGEEVLRPSGRLLRSSCDSPFDSWPAQPGALRPDARNPSSKVDDRLACSSSSSKVRDDLQLDRERYGLKRLRPGEEPAYIYNHTGLLRVVAAPPRRKRPRLGGSDNGMTTSSSSGTSSSPPPMSWINSCSQVASSSSSPLSSSPSLSCMGTAQPPGRPPGVVTSSTSPSTSSLSCSLLTAPEAAMRL